MLGVKPGRLCAYVILLFPRIYRLHLGSTQVQEQTVLCPLLWPTEIFRVQQTENPEKLFLGKLPLHCPVDLQIFRSHNAQLSVCVWGVGV